MVYSETMKLLIRNLTRTTTEAEIREIFEAYGTVQSCTLVMDKETGKSKGFGFIEMPSAGDAKAAIKRLNGEDVDGNNIRVKRAEQKSDKDNSKEDNSKEGNGDSSSDEKPRAQDPLHGVTLEMVVTRLVEKYGWEELGERIKIKCFTSDPSISSSLKFLRKTAWARQKVEALYLRTSQTNKESVWPKQNSE